MAMASNTKVVGGVIMLVGVVVVYFGYKKFS